MAHLVRLADPDDAGAVGRLLYDFNREFDEPTPAATALADRIRQLLTSGDTLVLLAGGGPDGVAVLRFRAAIWSTGQECYLAELYVTPARRGRGLGRALMEAALREARKRGADTMDIGVDEPDHVARRLYESLGFTNRTGGPDGPVMFVYERELLGHRERTPILARDSGSDRVPEAGNVGRDGMRSDPPRRSLMPLSGCLLSEVRPGRPWLGPLGRSRLAGCGQVEEGAASFVQP